MLFLHLPGEAQRGSGSWSPHRSWRNARREAQHKPAQAESVRHAHPEGRAGGSQKRDFLSYVTFARRALGLVLLLLLPKNNVFGMRFDDT